MGRPIDPNRLPKATAYYLQRIAARPRVFAMGNSVLSSLQTRGLVESSAAASRYHLTWRITEAGREALRQLETAS